MVRALLKTVLRSLSAADSPGKRTLVITIEQNSRAARRESIRALGSPDVALERNDLTPLVHQMEARPRDRLLHRTSRACLPRIRRS